MISVNQLAVCMNDCVRVFEVATDLSYKVTSKDWKGKEIRGIAVSDALPDNMLVICDEKPYVYQCPRHESTKVNKKFKIQSEVKKPLSIAAKSKVAVINMIGQRFCIVCKIPGFTQQTYVQQDFSPYDLSIGGEYLFVMGMDQMVVKSLADVKQEVCRVKPPPGLWEFRNVTCRSDGREIYAGCRQGKKYCVYKYTWNGVGYPEYVISACILTNLGCLWNGRLSVTSDGLLAVEQFSTVKIYKF